MGDIIERFWQEASTQDRLLFLQLLSKRFLLAGLGFLPYEVYVRFLLPPQKRTVPCERTAIRRLLRTLRRQGIIDVLYKERRPPYAIQQAYRPQQQGVAYMRCSPLGCQ